MYKGESFGEPDLIYGPYIGYSSTERFVIVVSKCSNLGLLLGLLLLKTADNSDIEDWACCCCASGWCSLEMQFLQPLLLPVGRCRMVNIAGSTLSSWLAFCPHCRGCCVCGSTCFS